MQRRWKEVYRDTGDVSREVGKSLGSRNEIDVGGAERSINLPSAGYFCSNIK